MLTSKDVKNMSVQEILENSNRIAGRKLMKRLAIKATIGAVAVGAILVALNHIDKNIEAAD